MDDRTEAYSARRRSIGFGLFYALALIPGVPLAYAGLGWVTAYERGWRTQVAAAALVVALFPLVGGLIFAWQATQTRSTPSLLKGFAFFLAAVVAYAVAVQWGGRMLI